MDERLLELLAFDPAVLSHDELFDLIDAIRETHAALDALLQHALAATARIGSEEFRAEQWIREEVAAALRIAPVTAAARLADATELVNRFPATLRALAGGRITVMHARALVDAVRLLDDKAAHEIESRVLARCDTKTVGEFRQHLKQAVLSIAPAQAEQDHAAAVRQRDVTLQPDEYGMGTVHCHLRIDHALQVMHTLDTHAARLDDERCRLERRRGADHHRCLDVEWSRRSARRWRRLVVDPLGHLIGSDTYRPSEPLRRHVVTRDRTCRFPGCRRAAATGDLDHVLPHPHGPTNDANLHALCRRHHRMKHRADWAVRRTPGGNVWTSPTGRRYGKPAASLPIDTTDPPPF
ncbi:MAG: DUF222 domain-containing protein [Jatrophihabitans sp.]